MRLFLLILILVHGLLANELSITSKDGFKLYGWLDKPVSGKKQTPIVLFAHQFGANHKMWDSLARKLNSKGFATLKVDLRGHGKSILQNNKENKVITDTRLDHIKEALTISDKNVGFEKIPSDLIAWLELMEKDKTLDMDSLYLFGASLGGGSVIPLLNEYDAKGLVTISSGKLKKLAQDTDMALSTSMTKSLFIAAKNDPLGASDRAMEYGKKSISGTSLIISGDGHGAVILPKVEHYIFSFIDNIK